MYLFEQNLQVSQYSNKQFHETIKKMIHGIITVYCNPGFKKNHIAIIQSLSSTPPPVLCSNSHGDHCMDVPSMIQCLIYC